MKFYEFSFVKRIVLPSVLLLLPIVTFKTEIPAQDYAIMTAIALIFCSVLSAIFGKRINIRATENKVSIEQTIFGFPLSHRDFHLREFDHISVHRERVYTTQVPLPAHKGAMICSLVRGDFNLIIKTGVSEKQINKIANRLKELTGLPLKQAGEVLL